MELRHTPGFDMRHVPYMGSAPAIQDVLGGQGPCGLLAGPTVLPQVRAGKLLASGAQWRGVSSWGWTDRARRTSTIGWMAGPAGAVPGD